MATLTINVYCIIIVKEQIRSFEIGSLIKNELESKI